VRRRIVSAQIATRRQHIAVANDDRAEGKVSPRGLGDGDPHEMLVTWKGRQLRRARPGLARRGERGPDQASTQQRCKSLAPVIAQSLVQTTAFESPPCPTSHQILVFERDENQHAEHRHKNAEGALHGI
jgi:hypothetical protein